MAGVTYIAATAFPAIAADSPKALTYRRSIDIARFVAACGIVWDHSRAPYADIGYLSLALFLMLTSFLAVQSFERSDGTGFWFSRARRIALPWLFWSAVYWAVYRWVNDDAGPWWQISDPFTLLIGTSIHLWFLPFVMLALVTIPFLARNVRTQRAVWVACGGLTVLSLLLAWLALPVEWLYNSGAFNEPIPQWGFSLPLFLYGALAALAKRLDMTALPMATAAVISAGAYLIAPGFGSVQMVLTAVVFEALWRWNLKGTWPTTLAGLAFGVYLVHPFFLLVAFKFLGTDVDRSGAALFTIATSILATMILRRTPIVQRFI